MQFVHHNALQNPGRSFTSYICIDGVTNSQELNLKAAEVEALLVDLILDQRLHGKIDQIDGFLLLQDSKQTTSSKKHDSLERWSESLRSLTSHIADRVSS